MNTQKNQAKTSGRAFALHLVLLLTVGCLVCALFAGCSSKKPEPVAITVDNEEDGLYGYIEVEILTDWFSAYTDDSLFWHIAGTPDGYLYVIAMEKSTFESQFKDAFDYCYSEDENAQPPAAVRATGVMKVMDNELIEMGAEFMDWTEEDFKTQCGLYYIDLTATP